MDDSVVVIATETGPVRIAKCDFDANVHTLHQANETYDANGVAIAGNSQIAFTLQTIEGVTSFTPPVELQPAISPELMQRIAQFGVLQNSDKFFVVDGQGALVKDVPGIDPEGYKSNKIAWGVLASLKRQA